MITDEIREDLMSLRDEGYRAFQEKLIPSAEPGHIIGVRTPELRSLARRYGKREDILLFLDELPHKYFEEDQLHACILSGMKDPELCADKVSAFLPFVDNWATCDQLSPKIFKKNKPLLLNYIEGWIRSDKTYTVRFAIGMLMEHFLDDDFDMKYPEMVLSVKSDEYYVRMMAAWYFATALAKQYEQILPLIKTYRLEPWTHNKTIQKAVESYRITDEQKEYLKTLKVKLPKKERSA